MRTTATPDAAADAGFAEQGWSEGGTYTFAVYDDDGWKTVNGRAGRTPIATYTATLAALPFSFVEMAGAGPDADGFPRLSFGAFSPAQVHANLVSATPSTGSIEWNAPAAPSGERRFGLFQGWEFFQGPRLGNPAGTLAPGYRMLVGNCPGSGATAYRDMAVSPAPALMSRKSYAEFAVQYVDRNDGQFLSLVSFN